MTVPPVGALSILEQVEDIEVAWHKSDQLLFEIGEDYPVVVAHCHLAHISQTSMAISNPSREQFLKHSYLERQKTLDCVSYWINDARWLSGDHVPPFYNTAMQDCVRQYHLDTPEVKRCINIALDAQLK